MTNSRRIGAALVALLALGALVGLVGVTSCRPDAPSTDRSSVPTPPTQANARSTTTVPLTPVPVARGLTPSRPLIRSVQILPSRGAAGPDLLTMAAVPGSSPRVEVRPGGSPDKASTLPVQSPLSASGASGPLATAVVGDRRDANGRRVPYAVVSADRRTWTAKVVDLGGRDLRLDQVAVGSDRLVITAHDADGQGWVSSSTLGAPATFIALPAPAQGHAAAPVAVAAHDRSFVVVRTEGREGAPAPPTASVSTDDGRTWSTFAPVDPGAGEVSGAAWSGIDWLVSGSTYLGNSIDRKAVVWQSPDATHWSVGVVGVPPGDVDDQGGAPEVASVPVTLRSAVVAVTTCPQCTHTWVITRSGATWNIGPWTDEDLGTGLDAVAWPTADGPRVTTLVDGTLTAYDTAGRNGRLTTRSAVAGEPQTVLERLIQVGSSTFGVGGRVDFTRDPIDETWAQTNQGVPFVLRAGRLVDGRWSPAAMGSLADVSTATLPSSGAAVALGTAFEGDDFDQTWSVKGFVRASSTKAWQPTTLPTEGMYRYQALVDTIRSRTGWLAAAEVAPTGDVDQLPVRRGQIYGSADGLRWTAEKGTFSPEGLGGAINRLCLLSDGSGIAVGREAAGGGQYSVATVWHRANGSWVATTAPGDAASEATGCATVAGHTVVTGTSGSRSVLWSTDGGSLTDEVRLPPGTTRGPPQPWHGGLLAVGSLDSPEHTGPVLWWSADGTHWGWLPVASHDPNPHVDLHLAGDRLYVVTNGGSGSQVWQVGAPS